MTDGLMINFGPGMHLAPHPWINVEAIQRDNHPRADLILSDYESLTQGLCVLYCDHTVPDSPCRPVTKAFAGHVTEHIDQHVIVGVVREWFDLLVPGGELGIVQPDVWIALQYFKDGLISRQDLTRHSEVGDEWPVERWETFYRDGQLDSHALHSWNSVPERVHGLLLAVGFEIEVREPTREGMPGWPLTGFGGAQLAVVARKPLS